MGLLCHILFFHVLSCLYDSIYISISISIYIYLFIYIYISLYIYIYIYIFIYIKHICVYYEYILLKTQPYAYLLFLSISCRMEYNIIVMYHNG